jgi:CsoR family transcriptional regulator, copper-sensing transcriptional repressor
VLAGEAQKRVNLRLRRIEGQVRGLQRMVQDSALCVDLLTQLAAVQAALKGVGDEILSHHVHVCIADFFSRPLRAKEKARLEELEKIFAQYCKQPPAH